MFHNEENFDNLTIKTFLLTTLCSNVIKNNLMWTCIETSIDYRKASRSNQCNINKTRLTEIAVKQQKNKQTKLAHVHKRYGADRVPSTDRAPSSSTPVALPHLRYLRLFFPHNFIYFRTVQTSCFFCDVMAVLLLTSILQLRKNWLIMFLSSCLF